MSPKSGVPKTVTILGSTGSVGANTLDVIRRHPGRFRVAGLAAGKSAEELARQAGEFKPSAVYVRDGQGKLPEFPAGTRVFTGREGLEAFAAHAAADVLVAASSGTSALEPVLAALSRGRRVALANKEILVVAGALVTERLRRSPGAELIPVDSEHSAVFQCLQGADPSRGLRKIVLTGSGGPLREIPAERFERLPKELAVSHPKWKMGPKITVDSATLMNKGLEVIEASWLFGLPVDRIEVLIHPEAVIHSMVEFVDGSVLAQLGVTDMRLPIQYALGYPERLESPSTFSLDFATIASLSFSAPDRRKFPCLDLAYAAARQGGTAPCALSAADEIAVHAFLEDRIGFADIPRVIESVLSRHRVVPEPGLAEIRAVHDWAAQEAGKCCTTSKASSSSVSF